MMEIKILSQPDDVTCGPTSLHAVYAHYGLEVPLKELINEVEFLEEGGTLGVFLGLDALKRGFNVTIYSYNLRIFDPTWTELAMPELRAKLEALHRAKRSQKLRKAVDAYIRFIDAGGKIEFEDLHKEIFESYFKQDIPVLSALSATYLYKCKREYTGPGNKSVFDDIQGDPTGHFVVLYGIDSDGKFLVADPDSTNPLHQKPYYRVDCDRLIHSILLGVVTYDSNMLVIEPKKS